LNKEEANQEGCELINLKLYKSTNVQDQSIRVDTETEIERKYYLVVDYIDYKSTNGRD